MVGISSSPKGGMGVGIANINDLNDGDFGPFWAICPSLARHRFVFGNWWDGETKLE